MTERATIAGALIIGGASLYGAAPFIAIGMLGAGFGLGVVSLAN